MNEDELTFNRAHNYIKENFILYNLDKDKEELLCFIDGEDTFLSNQCYYIRPMPSDIEFRIPKSRIYNLQDVNHSLSGNYILFRNTFKSGTMEYDLVIRKLYLEFDFDDDDRYGEKYVI